MAFPTKANITALVCNGLRRPKLNHGIPSVIFGNKNMRANNNPILIPTRPQNMVAIVNFFTILLS